MGEDLSGSVTPSPRPHRQSGRSVGVFCALTAALLFGFSTPLIRPSLERTPPAAAAGYLYLGQAVVLSCVWIANRWIANRVRSARIEASAASAPVSGQTGIQGEPDEKGLEESISTVAGLLAEPGGDFADVPSRPAERPPAERELPKDAPPRGPRRREADLDRGDALPLIAGIITGGLIAPGAFTAGLALTPAHRVSLLLGLEIVFTLLIALVFRHERLSGRAWSGVVLLLAAGTLVALAGQSVSVAGDDGASSAAAAAAASAMPVLGALLIALACAGWAIDSNLTAGIAGKDPTAIVILKGWAAAGAYLGGSLLLGRSIAASPWDLTMLLVAGSLGYGLSLWLFIFALRHLGAALTTTLFSTAPIVGFAASVAIIGERPSAGGWIAFAIAGAGVLIVSSGRHEHLHEHAEITHAHAHRHDEHHDHEHDEGIPPHDGHSHVHTHRRLVHSHAHEADTHHAHRHPDKPAD